MTDTAIQRAPTGMELLAELSRKVSDPQAAVAIAQQIVDLEMKREAFLQSRERFEWEKLDREARVAFAEAFQKFKEDAPKILKTKHVNFGEGAKEVNYWHVELDKACDLLIPALLKVDITHRWKSADLPGGYTRVTCFLRHRLGHEEEGSSLAGPADQSGGKNPIQGVGSSTSYLERYTFLATCGIVPKGADDDGRPEIAMEGFDAHLKAIKEASTIPDLKEAHIAAVKASMKAFDKAANDKFNEAKNVRMGEVNRGEA